LFTLKKRSLPQFQAKEREYVFGAVIAVRVSSKQPLNGSFTEIASISCSAVHQHVPDEILEICPEPGLIGNREASLFPIANLFGNSL
jgi:hypothetical protein